MIYIFGIFILIYSYAGISQDLYSLDELKGEFQDLNTKILEDMESLPEAVSEIEKDFDEAIKVLQQGIGFLSANEVDFETVNIFEKSSYCLLFVTYTLKKFLSRKKIVISQN